ncbi:MAG: GNAT family N-acetyltransferase [Luteibacter sp.]
MSPDITIRDAPDECRFVAELAGATASAWYVREGHALRFLRVDVPAALEGKGVLSQLIRVALAEARARGLLVEPLCPEFIRYFRGHPETHDLLSPEGRQYLATPF